MFLIVYSICIAKAKFLSKSEDEKNYENSLEELQFLSSSIKKS